MSRPGKMGGFACKIKHLLNSDFHVAKPFYFTNPRVIYVLSGAKMHISTLLRGVVTFQGLKSSIYASIIRLIVLLAGPIPVDFLVIGYVGERVSKFKSCIFTFFANGIPKNARFFDILHSILHLMPQIQVQGGTR